MIHIHDSPSYPLLGTSSSKGGLEDSGSSDISARSAHRVDNLGAAWDRPQ
jgi:hypothetical protein